jgi:beta-N-acetylhexosaminidase
VAIHRLTGAQLTDAQLAGQRVIYSYPGLTPPRALLRAIRRGEAAGVIFFAGNISSPAQLAAVARRLQRADASRRNPVRAPLLLMADQEGGIVRRLPGPPDLSEKQIGQAADQAAQARLAGAGAAAALRQAGLNVNLAPVLDVYRAAGNFIDQYGLLVQPPPGARGQAGRGLRAQSAGLGGGRGGQALSRPRRGLPRPGHRPAAGDAEGSRGRPAPGG